MISNSSMILVGAFGAVSIGTFIVLRFLDPYRRAIRRQIRELGDHTSTGLATQGVDERSKPAPQTLLERLAASATDRATVSDRLAKAGIYDPPAVRRYFAFKMIAMLAPVTIGAATAIMSALPWEHCLVAGMIVGSAGAFIPNVWLNRRIATRHQVLRRSLPDFLDLMIVCLEGGLSLQDTLRRVTEELRIVHPELAVELSIVQRDVELGATIDQGLRRFATRSGHEGVRTLSTFVRETQRFGTNLSDALRSHADFLRSQREHAAEELAQKASVKILIPTLLLILPAVFVVLVGPAVIQIQRAFSGN